MPILLQGTVTFNGQDIAYTISEVENKQINISISFVKGSNTNSNNLNTQKAVFVFNNVAANTWKLDRNQTKSEIDINIKCQEEKIKKKEKEDEEKRKLMLLETPMFCGFNNLKIAYETISKNTEKDKKNLYIEANNKKISQENKNYFKIENEQLNVNLDDLVKYLHDDCGFIGRLFEPIAKGLCEDLERTVIEKINENNDTLDLDNSEDRTFENQEELENKLLSEYDSIIFEDEQISDSTHVDESEDLSSLFNEENTSKVDDSKENTQEEYKDEKRQEILEQYINNSDSHSKGVSIAL